MAGMARELGTGRVICSGHLVSQWQGQDQKCWISVPGRSLSVVLLKQTSSYLVTPPNAFLTVKAEILSFILPVSAFIGILTNSEGRSARLSGDQSCSSCVLELARTGKLHCSSQHHLPGPA